MSDSRRPTPDDPPAELSELESEPDGFVHVAMSCEQSDFIHDLRSSLGKLARLRGWTRVRIAGHNYFAWSRQQPEKRITPDVYLLDDPPTGELPRVWRTWLPGQRPPRWAVEIVTARWREDYQELPGKYEELGCQELVLFDPEATLGKTHNHQRVPLTVYRRSAEGRLSKVFAGRGPAWSQELGVWLVPRRECYSARLRLSEDEAGTKIVPTAEESVDAAERALGLLKATHDAELATREAKQARERAEERIRQLEQALREREGK